MLQIKLTDKVPTPAQTMETLTAHNAQFGIPMDYDRILEYFGTYTMKSTMLKRRVARYIGKSALGAGITDSDFKTFLRNANVVTGLLLTEKGQISLRSESIQSAIDTGLYSEELCKVMELYMQAKSYAQKVSMFPKIIDAYQPIPWGTYDGHRMILVKPSWVVQNTGRLGMREPAVINIAKELSDIFTVPKGWRFFEADSGQIEPRIIQSAILNDPQLKRCTMMYNDAYFGYVHYCTILTPEQRASGTLDIEPVELSDEIVAKRKKFKTYGNATMYGSTENVAHDPDKDAFISCIGNHPNRLKLQREIEARIMNGDRIFRTAFGTAIDITIGPSEINYPDKGSQQYFRHLVRCAINNPVQGTAADLMRISVREADRILRNTRASFIVKYTHDSGTFAIHESDYDDVIEGLKGVTSYQVEDWIPIYNDPLYEIENKSGMPRLVR